MEEKVKGIGQVLPEGKKFECDGSMLGLKNKEIIINGFRTDKARKGTVALIELIIVRTGEKGTYLTSSGVVQDQLKQVEDADGFPVRCRYMVVDNYHILKNPKDLEVTKDEE